MEVELKYIELVKLILEQHEKIIVANALLLQQLVRPPITFKSKAE